AGRDHPPVHNKSVWNHFFSLAGRAAKRSPGSGMVAQVKACRIAGSQCNAASFFDQAKYSCSRPGLSLEGFCRNTRPRPGGAGPQPRVVPAGFSGGLIGARLRTRLRRQWQLFVRTVGRELVLQSRLEQRFNSAAGRPRGLLGVAWATRAINSLKVLFRALEAERSRQRGGICSSVFTKWPLGAGLSSAAPFRQTKIDENRSLYYSRNPHAARSFF